MKKVLKALCRRRHNKSPRMPRILMWGGVDGALKKVRLNIDI